MTHQSETGIVVQRIFELVHADASYSAPVAFIGITYRRKILRDNAIDFIGGLAFSVTLRDPIFGTFVIMYWVNVCCTTSRAACITARECLLDDVRARMRLV
ncbi:MAG: hypothetical protein CL862_01820 [Cyanobium sp. NAT70]|nr:hypothetical protein [Cyanobium sp. NAT70]